MKPSTKRIGRWIGCWVICGMAWFSSPGSAFGQAPGVPGGELGYNAAMAKLFADIPFFSADVETTLTNLTEKTRLSVPMRMHKRQDQLRIELDFAKLKGTGLALQGLTAMQNIGMARMVSLVDPKGKSMTVLFPDLKAYTKVSVAEADLPADGFKVTKKPSGKDTVDGQPCVRQLVTLTSKDGTKVEATTWEAAALGNFPVRMLFRQKEGSMAMAFKGVVLRAPADDQFAVPSDHKPFDSMSSLMQEAMTRAITGPRK
ncbi:MAG: hypothetical protein JNL97_11710 [Verrucomicrobiales bacterium]|nr:hypothetical protein [Verrucomicrobiales bacterium]